MDRNVNKSKEQNQRKNGLKCGASALTLISIGAFPEHRQRDSFGLSSPREVGNEAV